MERNGVDQNAAQRIMQVYGVPITRRRASKDKKTAESDTLPFPAYYLSLFGICVSRYIDLPEFISASNPDKPADGPQPFYE